MWLITLGIILLTVGCGHNEHMQPPVIALGDSITHGTGEDWGLPNNSHASFLAQDLGRPLQNYAVRGAKVQDVLRLQLPTVAWQPNSIVLLMIGINDASNHPHDTAWYQQAMLDYHDILQAIKTSCVTCDVIVLTPFKAPPGVAIDNNEVRTYGLGEVSVAGLFGARVVDTYSQFEPTPDLMYGNLHPNDNGYRVIEKLILSIH